jgi:hypothetical protein
MTLRRIDHHHIESDEGWSVDTSSFLDLMYRDGQLESAVTMEGAGTLLFPCDVWISRMRIRVLGGAAEVSEEYRQLVEDRIEQALKKLQIRYRRR